MSFKASIKHSLNPKTLSWSFLWLVVPIVNIVSSFIVIGYWVSLVQACRSKQYNAAYELYGFLFVKGLFAAVILLAYAMPGIIVLQWTSTGGLAVLLIGLLFGWAGFVKFAESEQFIAAFSVSAFSLFTRLRFWLGLLVSGVFASVVGAIAAVIALTFQQSIVLPVFALAAWIVLTGSVLAALSGHAEN